MKRHVPFRPTTLTVLAAGLPAVLACLLLGAAVPASVGAAAGVPAEGSRASAPERSPLGGSPGVTLPAGWLQRVREQIEASEYRWSASRERTRGLGGTLSAPNRVQGIRTFVTDRGIEIVPLRPEDRTWRVGLRLRRFGHDGNLEAAGAADRVVAGERVELRRDGLVEWYANGPAGLETGFTLQSHGRPFVIDLGIASPLRPALTKDRTGVLFRDGKGRTVLAYDVPRVIDARGRILKTRLSLRNGGIRIRVDAREADDPVTLVPVATSPSWILEPNVSGSGFGTAVASAGDVNGDGFDDIVVGAYNFSAQYSEQGRAYVYLSSATGLSMVPAWHEDGENDSEEGKGSPRGQSANVKTRHGRTIIGKISACRAA